MLAACHESACGGALAQMLLLLVRTSCMLMVLLHAHAWMLRGQFSEAEVQAARRLVFSAAAARVDARPRRGKRKAPDSASPSPGPEVARPAKRPKAAGRGAKAGSAGKRVSAAAGGGSSGASPEPRAAAQGDAELGAGLAPGPGEAGAAGGTGAEGGEASDVQPKPTVGVAGAKRQRRGGDADAAQEPATAMCGPLFPCNGLAANHAYC